MLLKKFNQASSNQQAMMPLKRSNLEVFSQVRSSKESTPNSSLTEDEIISALDKELFFEVTKNGEMDPFKHSHMNYSAEVSKMVIR